MLAYQFFQKINEFKYHRAVSTIQLQCYVSFSMELYAITTSSRHSPKECPIFNNCVKGEALNVYKQYKKIGSLQQEESNTGHQKRNVSYDALVLDAKLRQSLMTVRSLGSRNMHIAALETASALEKSRHVPTFSSRWCKAAYIAPTYAQNTELFLTYLEQVLEKVEVRVIISSSDGTIAALRKHREQVEQRGVRIALARESALNIATNKDETLEVAKQLGVGTPRGVMVTSVSEVAEAIREIGLPAVVKPTKSWLWGKERGSRLLCQLVTTTEEARLAVEELTCFGGSVLFQQFLEGRQESVSLLYAHKDVYACFAQWTMRAQPPLGGVSTYRQSITLPPDTGFQAERLVREIDLEGYSQIQFRRDRNGKAYLMEINPRLTSGIEVAVRSGIDFPYLVYQWASGSPVDRTLGYRTGVRMRYLEGDFLTTMQNIAQRGRPGVTPPRRALLEFLATFFIPMGYDYFDWRDLHPALTAGNESVDRIRRQLKRILTRP